MRVKRLRRRLGLNIILALLLMGATLAGDFLSVWWPVTCVLAVAAMAVLWQGLGIYNQLEGKPVNPRPPGKRAAMLHCYLRFLPIAVHATVAVYLLSLAAGCIQTATRTPPPEPSAAAAPPPPAFAPNWDAAAADYAARYPMRPGWQWDARVDILAREAARRR